MKVLANNCVATIAVPKKAHSGGKVAYNPVLKLFVTMGTERGISVWSPDTGKVVELIDYGDDGCLDMVLAPRNHLVISYSEAHHGGMVRIYSLEKLNKKSRPTLVLDIKKDFLPDYPGIMALSPQKSLLVHDVFGDDSNYVCDISIDWEKPKVVKHSYLKKDTYVEEDSYPITVYSLCCAPDNSVIDGVTGHDTNEWFALLVGKRQERKVHQRNKDRANSENKEEEFFCTEKEVTVVEQQIEEELDTTLPKNDDNSDHDDNKDDRTPINVDVDDNSDDNRRAVDDDDDDDKRDDSDVERFDTTPINVDFDDNSEDNIDFNDNSRSIDDDDDDKRDDSDEEGFDTTPINVDFDDNSYDNIDIDDNSPGIDDNHDDKRDEGDDNCDKSDDYSDCDDNRRGINDSSGRGDNSDDNKDDIKDDNDVDDYSDHDENSDDRNDDNRDHDHYSSDDTCSDNTEKNSDVIDGGVIEIKREVIDHCILDGLEYKLNHQCKLIHDGQNLLIFSDDKIILLETLTNGSKAHLVVSGLEIITEVYAINHKGQLMVCDGEDSIKIYEYRCIPRRLEDMCRCFISEVIPRRYQESIEELSLPEIISDYLLYKDLGY